MAMPTDCKWVQKDLVLDYITASAHRTRFQTYLECGGAVAYKEYVTHTEFSVKLDRKV